MEPILKIIGIVLGSSGFSAIVVALLNRHWMKKDREDDKLNALAAAQKVLMIDRVRSLGRRYVDAGGITLEDKENIQEMHRTYKALGGNGHLDTIMDEVERLPIVNSWEVRK